MPVTVGLMKLAQLGATELFPDALRELLAAAEEELQNLVMPGDQDTSEQPEYTRFGVIADWFAENDEPELARAFRYIQRHKCKIKKERYGYFVTDRFPYDYAEKIKSDLSTLAGAAAHLAAKIEKARAELE